MIEDQYEGDEFLTSIDLDGMSKIGIELEIDLFGMMDLVEDVRIDEINATQ